jgi:formylglycine-generating enzyme required for sulfatase activity
VRAPNQREIGWYGSNASFNGVASAFKATSREISAARGFMPVVGAAGKQANAWGLDNMIGGVFEWVNDWYGAYTSASATNPTGPATGTYRVLRGGSWHNSSSNARAAYRYGGDYPSFRSSEHGFRLVRTP